MTATAQLGADWIADQLRQQIETGHYPPGVALPSKSAIRSQYGCSNDAAQAVLNALAGEGLIATRTGAGAFVRPPAEHVNLETLTSGFGDYPATTVEASAWVARLLDVPAGTAVTATDAVADEKTRCTWRHPDRQPAGALVDTQVQARTALPDERALLRVRPGTPVLVVMRVQRDTTGQVALVERVTALAAAYTLTLD